MHRPLDTQLYRFQALKVFQNDYPHSIKRSYHISVL